MPSRDRNGDRRAIIERLIQQKIPPIAAARIARSRDAMNANRLLSSLHSWRQILDPKRFAAHTPEIQYRAHRFYFIAPDRIFDRLLHPVLTLIGLNPDHAVAINYDPQKPQTQSGLWQEILSGAAEKIRTHELSHTTIPVVIKGYDVYVAGLMDGKTKTDLMDWGGFGGDWLDFRHIKRQNFIGSDSAELNHAYIAERDCRVAIISHMDKSKAGKAAIIAAQSLRYSAENAMNSIDIYPE